MSEFRYRNGQRVVVPEPFATVRKTRWPKPRFYWHRLRIPKALFVRTRTHRELEAEVGKTVSYEREVGK